MSDHVPSARRVRSRSTAGQLRRRALGFAVLSGIAVIAAAGIAAGDDEPRRPRLGIGGSAIDPAAGRTTEGSPTRGPIPPAGPVDGHTVPDRTLDRRAPLDDLPDILIGDEALRGRIDLASMRPDGGGFEVRLDGGRRARLTLDARIQDAAQKLLVSSRAPMSAIVVMSPDGRILALAGRKHGPPSEDGAYDLATRVWAPAASVFKLVTAAALLQAGVGPNDRVCFHGGIRDVSASNLVDDRRDRKCEDLGFAVARSQNAIVAKLAHKFLDGKRLAAAARAFGLGRAPAFSLDCEASRFTVPEGELELARFAAGFWSSELSAVDGAVLASVIANRGMRITPRIVSEVVESDGSRRKVVAVAPERAIPARVAAEIGRMMVATTESGTAYHAFHGRRGRSLLRGITVAGKTGSLDRDKPSYLGYSWFVGYAPAEKPDVIVAVVLGNPESWYLKAHTAARMLLEAALAARRRD